MGVRLRLTAFSVIGIVTGTALFGMVLGGMFGYGAGRIAPEFFTHLLVATKLEPQGVAIVLGAFGGVVCGGFLGALAVALHAFTQWIEVRRGGEQ